MPQPHQSSSTRPGVLGVAAIALGFLLFGAATLWLRYQPRGRVDLETERAQQRTERLAKLRADEAKALAEYGWVDRQAGVVSIPLDRAVALALPRLQQKPVRAGGIIPPSVPTNAQPVAATNSAPPASQPTPPPIPTNAPPPKPIPPPPGTNAPPQPPLPPEPTPAAPKPSAASFPSLHRLSAIGRLPSAPEVRP